MKTHHYSSSSTVRQLSRVIWSAPSKRYLGYIRSPNWITRRRKHLEAYPDCQIPGCCKPAIQVHHWSYQRLGDEHAADLCSICLHHHHQLHCMTIPDAANDNQLPLPFEEKVA